MTTLTQNCAVSNAQPLVIGEFSIRQDNEGRYSLNDLHRVSGGEDKHKPKYWTALAQTKEVIEEICKGGISPLDQNQVIKTVHGGNDRGTYVVRELVYSYAMWVSAKFHLAVIRAYDALATGKVQLQAALTTKQDRVPLKDAVNLLVAKSKFLNYSDAYTLVHQRFSVEHVEQIPLEQLSSAVEYVHKLVGEYVGKLERIDPELKALEVLSADVTNKVMDYYWSLHTEIKRLGGKAPEYPEFDSETIVRAVITRMLQSNRMMLTFDHNQKPIINFVPNNAWILHDANIAKIIGDPSGISKSVLPEIIKSAVDRMSK